LLCIAAGQYIYTETEFILGRALRQQRHLVTHHFALARWQLQEASLRQLKRL
jgi:hypothetical protein